MRVRDCILVFGSNLQGRHGMGAALVAQQHFGATRGRCAGMIGRSYGIPTKRNPSRTLPLDEIQDYLEGFLHFARYCHEAGACSVFLVTRVGCGLAGFKDEQIGPLFTEAPPNCILPHEWKQWRPDGPTHSIADVVAVLDMEIESITQL